MTQIFVKYILHLCIFRHLKLEIALAIPASNDEKYNSYTSISGSWHAPRPGSERVKYIGVFFMQIYQYNLPNVFVLSSNELEISCGTEIKT